MIDKSTQIPASNVGVRELIRRGGWTGLTTGLAPGYVQANVVILPQELAEDFRIYCNRNSQAMPILDVTAPGDPVPRVAAPTADMRTDVPRYRIYRRGRLDDEVSDIRDLWDSRCVAFLLGCSFTAESKLLDAGVRLRHLELGCNVPMFQTSRQCIPSRRFNGPLVVSMRPIRNCEIAAARQLTARYPLAHGAPVQIGMPEMLGINLGEPDWGDAVMPDPDETPVFWACGVTPQAAIMAVEPEIAITHAPGHMFITDLRDTQIEGIQPPYVPAHDRR